MSKRNRKVDAIRTRRAVPGVEHKNGNPAIMCPFCKPSHPIFMDRSSHCGTIVEVSAVQTVFRAKFEKKMVCLKCGHGGGEMVLFQNAFIHTHDCAPGTVVFAEQPSYSKWAEYVYKLPEFVKKPLEKRIGKAKPVSVLKEDGSPTDKIAGYFFWKGV